MSPWQCHCVAWLWLYSKLCQWVLLMVGSNRNYPLHWINVKFDCCATGGRLSVRRRNVAQVRWLGLLGQDGGLLCQLLIDPYLLINWTSRMFCQLADICATFMHSISESIGTDEWSLFFTKRFFFVPVAAFLVEHSIQTMFWLDDQWSPKSTDLYFWYYLSTNTVLKC